MSQQISLCALRLHIKLYFYNKTDITEQILTNIIWNVIVCKILKFNILKEKAYQALY